MGFDPAQTPDATARQGRVFLASTDTIPMTNLGRVRLLIVNPASSGRIVHLMSLVATNASAAPGSIKVWHNPTGGIPSAVAPIPAKNCYLRKPGDASSSPPLAVVYADGLGTYATAALATAGMPTMTGAGGSQLPTLGVPSQQRVKYDLSPVLLDPGASLGFDASLGALSVTGNSVLSIAWFEEG